MTLTKYFLFLILSLLIFTGCDDDDTSITNNDELFNKMLITLGGTDSIDNTASVYYESTGVGFEFQEDPEPVNGKVADFSYKLTYNLDKLTSKQDWSVETDYAYESNLAFVETIDGTKGNSEGVTGFFSQFFAGFGVEGDPMFSTKLAARQKVLFMSSPLAISKMIKSNTIKGRKLGVIHIGYNTSVYGFGSDTPDIDLIIDPITKLPLKSQTIENDPLYGDVVYEVVYADWSEIDGLLLPATLTHILDGNVIRTESIRSQEVNPVFEASDLIVATPDWEYDQKEAKYGYVSSQFHFRTLLQTFAIDFPVEITSQTSPLALPSAPVPNDPKVYRVSGDFQSHYTYAFEVDGGLLLYDSPINNRRSKVVLEKIRSDFSTAPIKYVVNSHNHFDHVGGVRGNLAEGGDLLVGSGSKSQYEEILDRPHTVLPNPINRSVNVIGITDEMILGEGDEQVILFVLTTDHAEEDDFIVIYKPSTKTIYSNDVYNPGFINVFDAVGSSNQERLVSLAKNLVDFVDSKGLDVETSYCSHGFTTQDFDFKTVRMLSEF